MNIVSYRFFPDWNSPGFDSNNYFDIFKNSCVIINAVSDYTYYPLHTGTLSLKYIIRGEEYYITKKGKYRVSCENFLIINEGQYYESKIETVENSESLSLFFDPVTVCNISNSLVLPSEYLLDNLNESGNSAGSVNFLEKLYTADKDIITMFQKIKRSLSGSENSGFYINELMLQIFDNMILKRSDVIKEIERMPFVKSGTKIEIYKRLSIAKDYILSCFSKKITLSDLATAACMCEHHLLREFKKLYNITPHQFLIRTRLNNAANLLANSDKSISGIASDSGFEYLSTFCETFSKHYQMSPSSYRNIKNINFQ